MIDYKIVTESRSVRRQFHEALDVLQLNLIYVNEA